LGKKEAMSKTRAKELMKQHHAPCALSREQEKR